MASGIRPGENAPMKIRILSRTDIDRALDARSAVDAMRVAFGEVSGGSANVPIRGQLRSADGITLLMPAWLGGARLLGAKLVSVFAGNPRRGEPVVQGAVLLLDANSGRARALLDGTRLTQIRTAAGSALATELLAPPDASVLAVFGAGPQGLAHVELLSATRRLEEIRVVSASGESARRLVAALEAGALLPPGDPGPPPRVRFVTDPASALAGADLVVTATNSTTPVFSGPALEAGAHVNAVGSYRPDMQEIAPEVVSRARIVVDQREAAWEETGDLIQALASGAITRDAVDAELGELVLGSAPPGAAGRDVTLFKSVGNAAQDVAIASAALDRAEALGLGVEAPL